MSQKPIRVRFAPSPTGYLHVGGVRTLLFNWLYARQQGGTLVLRIEDTDQLRSTPENEKMILEDIKSLGLDWDEGPNPSDSTQSIGEHGPYRQSERFSIYRDLAHKLLEEKKAYWCFCTDEELIQKRDLAMKMGKTPLYDGTCSRLDSKESQARVDRGEKAGLRFKSIQKNYVVEDLVRGNIETRSGVIGDFLITRSPKDDDVVSLGVGMPVYNFVCAIDDHLMGLTHVIRGEDHLTNTVKQLMIYDAFGWEIPQFGHLSMVLGKDKQKLSKRNGDVSSRDYLENGYLKEALLNFLALIGWWPSKESQGKSGHPEIFSPEELIEFFSLDGLQKSPGVFDVTKLQWMNGFHIRNMDMEELLARSKPYFENHPVTSQHPELLNDEKWLKNVLALVRTDATVLSDLPEKAAALFSDDLTIDSLDDTALQLMKEQSSQTVAKSFCEFLNDLPSDDVSEEFASSIAKEIGKKTGVKGKNLFMPLRIIVTGEPKGPELSQLLPLLGKMRTLNRIEKIQTQLKS